MKIIKLPNPVILLIGSMGAFWIADIVNPGFNPVAVMILLLIPILIFELLYPQPEIEQLFEQSQPAPVEPPVPEEPVSGDLVEDELASQE